ncbi:hypothetical protein BLA17378_05305 [Burkholderia aenigmatica]|uniref:Sigma-70 family RNA polymerase sigma factor n=1 Tax=Burkholderia aenigmatica TaxID=2015348 RepID=A0ABY6XXV3_9BURK|nr:sigma-70 family RNA polymerase sigma factor [Burkholderia aenigmatica]VWD02032.1 hypothetical protein BLA17378_05305 [Burkholderia aenigmatica]
MTAIFENTQQALHVSFLVTSLPSRQKQQLRLALIRILESVGRLSDRQAAFLDYLYGSSSGTINFDGLNGDEIRAQCAMVVGAVRDHLLKPERNAVWLRYACGMPARPASANRAADPGIPPSSEWKRALVEMRTYLRPSLSLTSGVAIMALIAAHSQPRQRQDGLSYQAIAEETHITVRTLERNAQTIRKRLAELEHQAVKRLTPLFVRNNVTIAETVEA